MQSKGSNEELFPLIIESLLSWDDKMQKECGYSFFLPIKLNLFSEKNIIKIIEKAVKIVNELLTLPENSEGLAPWIQVIGIAASKVKAVD
jgi:hypothetical protein